AGVCVGPGGKGGEGTKRIPGSAPLRHREVRRIGRCRFTDGTLAHVRTPGGSARPTSSTLLVSPDCSCVCRPNWIEPPWYVPVCPVVWEGWRRETSPYPDLCPRDRPALCRFR